ncbi:MAG: hypothetical protein AB7G06_09215 [Bdellovibrionales bacterium]
MTTLKPVTLSLEPEFDGHFCMSTQAWLLVAEAMNKGRVAYAGNGRYILRFNSTVAEFMAGMEHWNEAFQEAAEPGMKDTCYFLGRLNPDYGATKTAPPVPPGFTP